jgi:putative ABC transport system ATP-binding protein
VSGMTAELTIKDLTVEYVSGGYPVRPLDSFDLHVTGGELVLLLGASGCGKTTLLSALAGILRPKAGAIRVGDTDVLGLRGRALTDHRRHTVGVVFQAFNLVPSLTALENVAAPLWAAGWSARKAAARARQLLDQVDLTDQAGKRPGDMSGGQQQRVAIARALAHDPPLVLADEPTAHLDYIQVEGVLKLLRALAGPERVVVVATHDERLLPLADRIVELTPRAAGSDTPPTRLELAAGDVVFGQGDAGDRIYVVDSGDVEIVRTRAEGTEEVLGRIGPGRYFGELGPLFGLKRSATARAAVASVVTGYSVRDFRSKYGPLVSDLIAGAT